MKLQEFYSQLVSRTEACRLLHISPTWCKKLIGDGQLNGTNVRGSGWIVSIDKKFMAYREDRIKKGHNLPEID